jgi:hypothetical protein
MKHLRITTCFRNIFKVFDVHYICIISSALVAFMKKFSVIYSRVWRTRKVVVISKERGKSDILPCNLPGRT